MAVEKVVVPSRRGPAVVVLVVSLALVGVGVRTLLDPRAVLPRGDLVQGMALVTIFGLLALIALRSVLDARPRLVIDDEGIEDRTLGLPKIPWHAIRSARPGALRNLPLLCLEMHDEAAWLSKLSAPRAAIVKRLRAAGLTAICVNLLGTKISPTVLAELVTVKTTSTSSEVQRPCTKRS